MTPACKAKMSKYLNAKMQKEMQNAKYQNPKKRNTKMPKCKIAAL